MKPCKPGQERNPATNRCKKIENKTKKNINKVDTASPIKANSFIKANSISPIRVDNDIVKIYKPCKPDQERNPITKRCRKIDNKTKKNIVQKNVIQKNIVQGVVTNTNDKIINKRNEALTIIKRNLTKTRVDKLKAAIKSKFLKSICSDSGVCIAFGKEEQNIKKFFNGFTTFEYAVDPIQRIGAVSANGFVNEINYQRDEYKANTILKSSAKKNADNLMYEYVVGTEYINKLCKRYPCFVETYGLYEYSSNATMETMKNNKVNKIQRLKNLKSIPVSWSNACNKSSTLSILIQHLKSPEKLLSIKSDELLLYVLFQIYIPLALLSENFTHYDLHQENVLIYCPIKGKHIKYKYHLPNGTLIEFCSPYIVKIIDYGRSYFNNGTKNGLDIYKEICAQCKKCGNDSGFAWNGPQDSTHYISASTRNVSSDLRLLHILKGLPGIGVGINILTSKVVFAKKYGTPEIYNSTWIHPTDNINNVKDVLKWIIGYTSVFPDQTTPFLPENEIGTLNIYTDKDMEFIEKK